MRKKHSIPFAAMVLTAAVMFCQSPSAYAADKRIDATGAVYEFDKDSHYEISAASDAPGAAALGGFSLSGNIKADDAAGGIPSYDVKGGNVSLSYTFDPAVLDAPKEEWHLVDDKSKEIDGVKLEKNILSGALILQSSLDGKTWTEEVLMQDIFTEDSKLSTPFYTTTDFQQLNGCYFRLIVAYKQERKSGDHKVLFVTVDDKEYKKVAEVYEFYLHDTASAQASTESPDVPPRKELGEKVKTGKDNGFTGSEPIEEKDPHYGWDVGQFVINGYTRETEEDGTPVFLKTTGDKVTLWFQLEQDINCLNGNAALTIFEDYNGYDEGFEVPKTNFKRGTLLIKYVDAEGKGANKPVIYTDFLAAATASANTRAVLFEEGDYEVSLDYEIQNSPKIGPVSIPSTYTNYKISFSFKIRNGDCMVFPKDAVTGSDLSDHMITPNGFSLNMALSRYLTIDVQRAALKTNAEGLLVKDLRENEPAKDGETYTEEGIYTFTVKNQYTGATTTKTIYVGTDKYLKALSKHEYTVDELNELIREGAVILDDGAIQLPNSDVIPEPTPAPTPTPLPTPNPTPVSAPVDLTEETNMPASTPIGAALLIWPLTIFGLVAVVVCLLVFARRKKKRLAASDTSTTVTVGGFVKVQHKKGKFSVSKTTNSDEEDEE